jgi:hypothetical protein
MTTAAHGLPNTYKSGCRCKQCREANRVYQAAANARRAADPKAADLAGHGKPSTYSNYLCRCTECRAANAVASQTYRAKRSAA